MAKVPFSKLKCKINEDIKELQLSDDITIEVKQYLPIQEKLKLIGRVIELAHQQDYDYSNPVKVIVFKELEMVYQYTNLSFTEKQKEDPAKLYDSLYSSGILAQILDSIPTIEKEMLAYGIEQSIISVYQYQNSVFGILDSLRKDYDNLNLDVQEIASNLSNPEVLTTVRDVLTKLG